MGSLLGQYHVMQRNTWATRTFYMAQERRTGQVVYLIEEPVISSSQYYEHPALPTMAQVGVEAGSRWLRGPLPEGETLEDLRARGELTEADIVSALLTVIDAVTNLARLEPPVVPSYLDPACIRRDRAGQWLFDYLALAHAPEARMTPAIPLGVQPVGVLLYWLITGQSARRTRVQVTRMAGDVAATLQFIVVKCLGHSYPSLAEVRADLERAGKEHAFRSVVQILAKEKERRAAPPPQPALARRADQVQRMPRIPVTVIPPVPLPQAAPPSEAPVREKRPPAGPPYIAPDDRPWAPPPRPAEGYRKFVVPPKPARPKVPVRRWASLGGATFVSLLLCAGVAAKLGVISSAFLPSFLRASAPASAPPAASQQPGGEVKSPDPQTTTRQDDLLAPHDPPAVEQPTPPVETPPAVTPPSDQPPQVKVPPPTSAKPIQPPGPPEPSPGTVEYQDKRAGGQAVLVYLDKRSLGYAYLFPHPRSPYISLGAFNNLFGRTLYWTPAEGGSVRIYTSDRSFYTADYQQLDGRLWLQLTPDLLKSLGLQMQSATDKEIYVSTR